MKKLLIFACLSLALGCGKSETEKAFNAGYRLCLETYLETYQDSLELYLLDFEDSIDVWKEHYQICQRTLAEIMNDSSYYHRIYRLNHKNLKEAE